MEFKTPKIDWSEPYTEIKVFNAIPRKEPSSAAERRSTQRPDKHIQVCIIHCVGSSSGGLLQPQVNEAGGGGGGGGTVWGI